MFDLFETARTAANNIRLSARDLRAYDRAALIEERDELMGRFGLNAQGRARLAELNDILEA
jgi:hypothetical protein